MAISGVNSTIQKARKDYTCHNCGLLIPKGSLYEKDQYYMGPVFRYHLGGGLGGDGEGCQEAQRKENSHDAKRNTRTD